MKICDQYNHHSGLEKILNKENLLKEIQTIINDKEITFGKVRPCEIKSRVSQKFNEHGWADNVKVDKSRLTISFLKSKVGVCFQIGNVARTYADLLKLSQLYKKEVINVGVIVVPHKFESKLLGANYAQYERLAKELSLFSDIISTPILLIGVSN